MESLSTEKSLAAAVARPLPDYWPNPTLPKAAILSRLEACASQKLIDATEEAEAVSWQQLAAPKATASPAKKKNKRKIEQLKVVRSRANEVGTLCKCGKEDVEKFMLQCDGCDIWFHGECVGVSQQQAARSKSWRCRTCERRHVARQARCQRYCVCNGPWDGRSFMLACDSCDLWFHGACVGLRGDTLQQGAELAFRKYLCPSCDGDNACKHASALRSRPASSSSPRARPKANGKARADASVVERYGGGESGEGDATTGLAGVSNGACAFGASSSREAPPPLVSSSPSSVSSSFDGATAPSLSSSSSSSSSCACSCSPCSSAATATTNTVATTSSSSSAMDAPTEADAAEAAERPCYLLDLLTDDCLAHVLAQLPLASLLVRVVPCARRLALLAEPHFMLVCAQRGWRPTRRARDHPAAWRNVLRMRACGVCLGKDAHFPVRKGAGGATGGTPLFRLCRECARRDKVQQQVQRHGYEVDAIGEHGKPLFARQFHMPLFGHANGFSTGGFTTQVNRAGL